MMRGMERRQLIWTVILWVARVTSVAVLVPVLMILVGEPGTGPQGAQGWIYLALFPVGFSAGYLLAWRWPVFGGCLAWRAWLRALRFCSGGLA
jgi:hypothetical protein